MSEQFQFGVDVLLAEHLDWLRGARVGLVAHAASVDAAGVPSATRLRVAGVNLAALFGPEHGFAGVAAAGEEVGEARHPEWQIPIHSLYGATRKPTPEMLANVDVLLFDLQDLGVRCYTYSATLRNILEAAAENHKAVIVLDRPVPLAGVVDGPLPEAPFMSFVAAIPVPFCYGLTPGQTALWLCEKLELDLDLRVVAARGVPPSARWIPPSPAIRSPAHALAYPATVLFEAFPALDVGRKKEHAFQGLENGTMLSSKDWKKICEEVSRQLSVVSGRPSTDHEPLTTDLCGVHIAPLENGLRLRVTNLADYRPALVSVALVRAVQQVWGADTLWGQNGARPDWFDKLLGTDRVRLALRAGAELAELGAMWDKDRAAFRREVAR
jgi:uncharacterized protein YbbC (DUF1343 family)